MPFLRGLIPLAGGVLCYDPLLIQNVAQVLATSVLLLLIIPLLSIAARFRLRHISAIAFLGCIFCLGYGLRFLHDLRNDPRWLGHARPEAICATITSEPSPVRGGIRLNLRVIAARQDGAWSDRRGYLQAFARSGNYATGDTLILPAIHRPLRTSNMGYRLYLERKNIHHSLNLESGQYALGKGKPGPVSLLRKTFLSMLDSLFPDRNEKAMAQALLLGYRADMDKELLKAYTQTGVVHVIAVSGMHLALIYSLISFLLKPLRNRRTKQLRTLLIIALLWLFALVCGGSPSVVRSALMFSFILWADVFRREHRPANTLAGSMFILICVEPVIVYDIGFQLSYAAVAGLMLYSGPLTALFRTDNRILRYGWSAIATTLAAQVLTTPLVLVHFGQFPLLFLPANLFAVPVSGIILVLLIIACALDLVGISWLPASLAGTLMRSMNQTIAGLGSTRFSTLEHVHIRWYDAVNIYIVILALTLWLRSKK
jgi:competence protein ComEC